MNAHTEKQFDELAQNAVAILEDEAAAHGIYPLDGNDMASIMSRINVVCSVQAYGSQVFSWGIGAASKSTILGGIDLYGNFAGAKQREAVLEFVRRHLPDGEDVAVGRFDRETVQSLMRPIIEEAKTLEVELRSQMVGVAA